MGGGGGIKGKRYIGHQREGEYKEYNHQKIDK